jgi:hypothetical protein
MVVSTKNKIFIAINGAVNLTTLSAQGQTNTDILDFPLYALSKQCNDLARIISNDQFLRDSCLQLDERQKKLLQRQWNNVPVEVRQVCPG